MRTPTLAVLFAAVVGCTNHSSGGQATGSSTTGGKSLLPAGASCSSNPSCASGVCGVGGTGNCCAQACATSDPTCGATNCDGTGACFYPGDTIACPVSCSGSTLSQNACNGAGACTPVDSTPCPGDLACRGDGGVCDTTCASSSDCASGFVCNAGACVKPVVVGLCSENDDCDSEHCGIAGTGHCCAAACANDKAPCGATDCYADSGACVYPYNTGCGSAQSCDAGIQTNAARCDGAGNCGSVPPPIVCAPYTCSGDTCDLSCDQDGGCAAGGSCDLFHHVCCNPGLQAGGSMAVDAIAGDDSLACCGIEGNQPCQTIIHAMQVIDLDEFRDVTIHATVDGGGGVWPGPPMETYPILLGWGVEMSAPGITFGIPNNPNVITFTIGRVSFNDQIGYASIVGAPGALADGYDYYHPPSVQVIWPTNLTHIQIESGSTLYLAGVYISGDQAGGNQEQVIGSGIDVAAGGALVIGSDEAGTVSGTTVIKDVGTGVECEGGQEGDIGCSVSDVPIDGGAPSLVINATGNETYLPVKPEVGIAAGDNTNISLTAGAIIGVPRFSAFDGGFLLYCLDAPKSEAPGITQGVVLSGTASMTFENGIVQCVLNQGFYLGASTQGVPTLGVSNSTIQDTGLGVYASAGTATISSSVIQYNGGGVEQDTDGVNIGKIDLSGGAAAGTNVVACNNRVEGPAGVTGVSVLNTTSQPLNASNVAWDTPTPDLFQCDANIDSCTCEIASCTAVPAGDAMDAVYESTGTITTAGNTLSNLDCTPPFVGQACNPGSPLDCGIEDVPAWMTCCPVSDGGGVCDVVCQPP